MSSTKPLTVREAAFVREYLLSGKQTEAYIKAGYSPKSARPNAARMMEKENVAAAIHRSNLQMAERHIVTRDKVLAAYSRVAFTGMSRFLKIDADGQPSIDLSECTPGELDSLNEITVETVVVGKGEEAREVRRSKIKLMDRLHALDKLAMHLGMFKDKNGELSEDSLASLLREIQERGSALPVKPQGPMGSQEPHWKKQ